MRQCPRCASEITAYDKVCPRCKLPVDKMTFEAEASEETEKKVVYASAEKRAEKRRKKEEKKAAKKAKRLQRERSTTDFSKFVNGEEEQLSKRKARKNKKNKLEFDIDENGELNIDTSDVEIVGKETGKLIEERYKQTYSVKKARGDYRPPKIAWWEIYKIADRAFARRKIKKEVNKAAKVKPDFISKTKLILLAVFFGWLGVHNFYVKNKKKGWTSLISCFAISLIFIVAPEFFMPVRVSIGGLFAFIVFWIWWGDIINIAFGSFKYRIQKEKFIEQMNIETRAKLGEKYIDMDLYRSPWWNRLKVWLAKKKRSYQEYKHHRRQLAIEKEKARQEKLEAQAKIDSEIAEFEAKEMQDIKKAKTEKLKAELEKNNVLAEIKEFDGEVQEEKPKKKPTAPKKAKLTVKTNKNKNTKNNKNKK